MNAGISQDNFLRLIEANKGLIIKICNSYCTDAHDRQDLAQEIIYNLWKAGKNFKPDYKFSTWMYRVALNVAISYYRSNKKRKSIATLADVHINIAETSHGNLPSEQDVQLMLHCIAQLKELDKALMLLWLEAKPYREIADIMGITETNVATRIGRTKERLKQQILDAKKQ